MSKLSEYLKLIPEGIKNIDEIAEGLRNNIKLERGDLAEDIKEIILERRKICSTCPYNSIIAQKLGYYATARTDEHCIHCGCPIDIRTASLDANCGIESFNKKNPKEPLELKWSKVEKDEQPSKN